MVMSIHSFGDYSEKFHPHLHAIVSHGLFARTGTFYVMLGVDLKPLEETCPPLLLRRRGRRVFRASVFKMLKEEGKIGDDLINRLIVCIHCLVISVSVICGPL